MWFLVFTLLSLARAESPEPKLFDCLNSESLMALKALYLCSNGSEFGKCGSLSGYLAGHPLSEAAQAEAKEMIRLAATKKLEPPKTGSFSVLTAMENNQFEADAEDYMPIKLPTPTVAAYAGLRYAAIKTGILKYEPCLAPGQAEINSEPTKKCVANPLTINDATYKFLNDESGKQLKAMSNQNVCDHYKQRYEHLIRRTAFADFKCEGDSLTSSVRRSETKTNLQRKISFDSEGQVTSIEFRLGDDGGRTLVEFNGHAPSFVSNYVYATNQRPGKKTSRFAAANLNSQHPYYTELARLKFETKELINCCRETDVALKVRCRNAFSGNEGTGTVSPSDNPPAMQ